MFNPLKQILKYSQLNHSYLIQGDSLIISLIKNCCFARENCSSSNLVVKSQDLKPEYLGSNYFTITSVILINLINLLL